jgi:hypothetical protein
LRYSRGPEARLRDRHEGWRQTRARTGSKIAQNLDAPSDVDALDAFGHPAHSSVAAEQDALDLAAGADSLAKLVIAKGVITEEEFKAQLSTERANYLAVLKRLQ